MNTSIITVRLANHKKIIKKAQYQHDYGMKLRLQNAPICDLIAEFCNVGDCRIKHTERYNGTDITIPSELFADGRNISVYLTDISDGRTTLYEITILVEQRPSVV